MIKIYIYSFILIGVHSDQWGTPSGSTKPWYQTLADQQQQTEENENPVIEQTEIALHQDSALAQDHEFCIASWGQVVHSTTYIAAEVISIIIGGKMFQINHIVTIIGLFFYIERTIALTIMVSKVYGFKNLVKPGDKYQKFASRNITAASIFSIFTIIWKVIITFQNFKFIAKSNFLAMIKTPLNIFPLSLHLVSILFAVSASYPSLFNCEYNFGTNTIFMFNTPEEKEKTPEEDEMDTERHFKYLDFWKNKMDEHKANTNVIDETESPVIDYDSESLEAMLGEMNEDELKELLEKVQGIEDINDYDDSTGYETSHNSSDNVEENVTNPVGDGDPLDNPPYNVEENATNTEETSYPLDNVENTYATNMEDDTADNSPNNMAGMYETNMEDDTAHNSPNNMENTYATNMEDDTADNSPNNMENTYATNMEDDTAHNSSNNMENTYATNMEDDTADNSPNNMAGMYETNMEDDTAYNSSNNMENTYATNMEDDTADNSPNNMANTFATNMEDDTADNSSNNMENAYATNMEDDTADNSSNIVAGMDRFLDSYDTESQFPPTLISQMPRPEDQLGEYGSNDLDMGLNLYQQPVEDDSDILGMGLNQHLRPEDSFLENDIVTF